MNNLYLSLLLALCVSVLVVRAQDDTVADTETEPTDDVSVNVFVSAVKSLYAVHNACRVPSSFAQVLRGAHWETFEKELCPENKL